MGRWLELCSTCVYDPHRNPPVNSGSQTWPVLHPAGWKTPAVLTGVLSVENVSTMPSAKALECCIDAASSSFSGKKTDFRACVCLCVCLCKTTSLNPLRKNLSSVTFLCAQQWYADTNDENEKQTSGASVVKQRRSLKIHKDEKSASFSLVFHKLLAFCKSSSRTVKRISL